jgi:hypothetical protein
MSFFVITSLDSIHTLYVLAAIAGASPYPSLNVISRRDIRQDYRNQRKMVTRETTYRDRITTLYFIYLSSEKLVSNI